MSMLKVVSKRRVERYILERSETVDRTFQPKREGSGSKRSDGKVGKFLVQRVVSMSSARCK